jgi:hypothetical protein
MSDTIENNPASGPYETGRQATADMASVYQMARRSNRWGALAEANLARLADTCQRAGVTLGRFDARILAWLANYEPGTCAVIAGLVTRAHDAGLSADGTVPVLDPYCQAGQHANCPGRLCQCPHCQHQRPTCPTV